ncbi:MAG: DNA polymerase III subunit delta' [Pseudomonadota bacterium]
MPAPYPWLAPVWPRLMAMRQRMPHALLLAGPQGVGKRELARAWAQSLLCEQPQPDGDACGKCEGCHWFDAGTHPDFLHLTLLEKENRDGEVRMATEISVEQARQAVDFVRLSTYRAGYRMVLIEPAEALNTASANALLKVLEEPPINTVFILVSHQFRQLLPTILSRCHKLEVGLPDKATLPAWLGQNGLDEKALAWVGGAPLAAITARDEGELEIRAEVLDVLSKAGRLDGVALAEAWNRQIPARTWHRLSYKWLLDLLACRLGGKAGFNPDYEAALRNLARRAKLANLLDLVRHEAEAGRWVEHPLNRQMVMESWLIEYGRIFEGAGR